MIATLRFSQIYKNKTNILIINILRSNSSALSPSETRSKTALTHLSGVQKCTYLPSKGGVFCRVLHIHLHTHLRIHSIFCPFGTLTNGHKKSRRKTQQDALICCPWQHLSIAPHRSGSSSNHHQITPKIPPESP